MARIHARSADCRREHLHRVSTRIVQENQLIATERLDVKAITTSARGTPHAPGSGVKAKSRRDRTLLDASISELLRQIRYKAQWYGRTLVEVAQDYPSSQRCSACGHLEAGLRLDEHAWIFAMFAVEHDRDVNAEFNFEAEGLRVLSMHPEDSGGVRASGGEGEGPRWD